MAFEVKVYHRCFDKHKTLLDISISVHILSCKRVTQCHYSGPTNQQHFKTGIRSDLSPNTEDNLP